MSPFLLFGLTSGAAPVVTPTQSESFRVAPEDRVLAISENRQAMLSADGRLIDVDADDRRTVIEQQPRRLLH